MNEILRISPSHSRQLLVFVWGSHLLALCVTMFLPLSFLTQASLLLLIMLSLWHHWHASVIGDHERSIKIAEWGGADEWILFNAEGKKSRARLLSSSYVQPWLVVLSFYSKRFGRCRLIILPDSIDADLLRRLRVRLKWLRDEGLDAR